MAAGDRQRGQGLLEVPALPGVVDVGEQHGRTDHPGGAELAQDQDPLGLGQSGARAGVERSGGRAPFVDQLLGRRAAKIEIQQQTGGVGDQIAGLREILRGDEIGVVAQEAPKTVDVLAAVFTNDEGRARAS